MKYKESMIISESFISWYSLSSSTIRLFKSAIAVHHKTIRYVDQKWKMQDEICLINEAVKSSSHAVANPSLVVPLRQKKFRYPPKRFVVLWHRSIGCLWFTLSKVSFVYHCNDKYSRSHGRVAPDWCICCALTVGTRSYQPEGMQSPFIWIVIDLRVIA